MVSQEVVQSAFWVVHELTRMHGLTRKQYIGRVVHRPRAEFSYFLGDIQKLGFPDNSARGQLGPWTARPVADNSART